MCWTLGDQVPGQKFLDTVNRMIGDTFQDMASIDFGIRDR